MDRLFVEEQLFGRLEWFIRIRWVFLAGLIITLPIAHTFETHLPYLKILLVAGFIACYNTALYFYHRRDSQNPVPDDRATQLEANFQISADYVSLSAVIHFAGGVENPFIFLYLLHVIIGSIMLNRKQVWAHGMLAYLLFVAVVLLEYTAILPHYTLSGLYLVPKHKNLWFALAVSGTLFVTVVSTIHMLSSIVESLRAREIELIQAQNMLQRKSQALEDANKELKDKQAQLVQSEKLASLGQLSAGIAHEINNPIQFIQGNMRILTEAMDTIFPILDRQAESNPDFKVARLAYPFFKKHIPVLLKDMTQGTVRIADIVKDLKKFARADEGRLDEAVDVNEVMQESLRLVHNKVRHMEIHVSLNPDLPRITGNATKIEQVMVINLINAAEALGEQPGGLIRISTRFDPEDSRVIIAIEDNGPGMTAEVKGRLFDPFFSTKQRSGGTGLGLSIAYGIIKDHGGSIEVDTAPGNGTKFRFSFPVKKDPS
jgi:signal transduction histidine kinase